MIASSFGIRFGGYGYFLTDARMHRGASGAPVVARAAQRRRRKDNPILALAGRARCQAGCRPRCRTGLALEPELRVVFGPRSICSRVQRSLRRVRNLRNVRLRVQPRMFLRHQVLRDRQLGRPGASGRLVRRTGTLPTRVRRPVQGVRGLQDSRHVQEGFTCHCHVRPQSHSMPPSGHVLLGVGGRVSRNAAALACRKLAGDPAPDLRTGAVYSRSRFYGCKQCG